MIFLLLLHQLSPVIAPSPRCSCYFLLSLSITIQHHDDDDDDDDGACRSTMMPQSGIVQVLVLVLVLVLVWQ